MGKVIIRRSNQPENKGRKINILLNGNKAGEITHNETMELELPAGSHTLEATIDWCGSRRITFTLKPDETKHFFLSGQTLRKSLIPFVTAFRALYYVSLGRREFLILEEKKV